jgi:predicted nuclease of predicted toxin-antitoxin system
VKKLDSIFKEVLHAGSEGLSDESDFIIWSFALKNNLSLITFDHDFYDIMNLRGYPPKIISFRVTNENTENVANLIRRNIVKIKYFCTLIPNMAALN